MQMLKTILLSISRLLIGFTFILSGFVKAIDPAGMAIKFEDYFQVLHLQVFLPYAVLFAFLLAAIEFLLGVNVLLSLNPRQSSIYMLLVMSFMTPLTLYLAIANPVSDCGCFGDFIKLTNWQTFGKNVVLMAAAIYYFLCRNDVKNLYHHKIQWFPSAFAIVFILSYSYHNYTHLPDIDFLPYKVGTNIIKGMEIPKNAPSDLYETTFIYSKNGVKKEFTLQNYPANDTTWHFVDQKSVLIKKGFTPPIHDFSIRLKETGEEITDIVLNNKSFVFLLVAPDFHNANDAYINQINDSYDFAKEKGYKFYALTASTDADIKEWIEVTGAEYPICFTDKTTLKTMIRANPGLVILKDGVVVSKWSSKDIPVEEDLLNHLKDIQSGKMEDQTKKEQSTLWRIAFWVVGFLVILLLLEKIILVFSSLINKKQEKKRETDLNTNENQ